mmetsp:Transcript_17449/g.65998  ORF Transcript_17449/g.65998 Transcript_17449/m.65998 type:complete len:346 (+) Transcript_17449:1291-2328(+)
MQALGRAHGSEMQPSSGLEGSTTQPGPPEAVAAWHIAMRTKRPSGTAFTHPIASRSGSSTTTPALAARSAPMRAGAGAEPLDAAGDSAGDAALPEAQPEANGQSVTPDGAAPAPAAHTGARPAAAPVFMRERGPPSGDCHHTHGLAVAERNGDGPVSGWGSDVSSTAGKGRSDRPGQLQSTREKERSGCDAKTNAVQGRSLSPERSWRSQLLEAAPPLASPGRARGPLAPAGAPELPWRMIPSACKRSSRWRSSESARSGSSATHRSRPSSRVTQRHGPTWARWSHAERGASIWIEHTRLRPGRRLRPASIAWSESPESSHSRPPIATDVVMRPRPFKSRPRGFS